MDPMNGLKSKSAVFILLYFLIFTALFISYPLHGSLLSDMDSWFYVAWFNYYYNWLGSVFTGVDIGQTFYPDPHPYLLGEPSFGIFLIWLPFKLFGFGEIWSYFLMMIVILVINGYSVYKLAGAFFPTADDLSRFLAGLFFTVNNFALANLDNPNTVFWGPGILAIYFLKKALDSEDRKFIILFSALFLLQLSMSVYNAMYTGIFVLCILIFSFKKFRHSLFDHYQTWLVCIITGAIVTGAYFYLLLGVADKSRYWNYSSDMYVVKYLSFHWKDFFRVLPGNIYHPAQTNTFWAFYYKSFFLGILVTALAIWGIITQARRRPELLTVFLTALIIGLGTFIVIAKKRVMMPLGLLFENFDLYGFYRFPFRMFLVMSLVIALFCISPLDRLISKVKSRWLLATVLGIIFLVENIPLKRTYYQSHLFMKEGKYLEKQLSNKPMSTYLFLPTGDFIDGQTNNINRTENIYMFWQTRMRKNVMNGYSSFFPPERLELNNALLKFKEDRRLFINYLRKYDIRNIIYYTDKWGMEKCPVDLAALRKLALEEKIQLLVR